MKSRLVKIFQMLVIAGMGVGIFLFLGFTGSAQPAHAFPEYSSRTNESCATCHVNPGGGGPRTLRGLLWAAQGRPDVVAGLANVQIAPGVTDGLELYDISCAACHGSTGEGLFGTALTGTGLRESKISSSILRGRERSGMPGFDGQFSDDQMDALVEYVVGLSSGTINPPPASYPLEPAQFGCAEQIDTERCGGN